MLLKACVNPDPAIIEARIALEALRKGIPPYPLKQSLGLPVFALPTIDFFSPNAFILQLESGEGQSHRMRFWQQQAAQQGFATAYLILGQGAAPLLPKALNLLEAIVASTSLPNSSRGSHNITQPEPANLLSRMLAWEAPYADSEAEDLLSILQHSPRITKGKQAFNPEMCHRILLVHQTHLKARNCQGLVLFLDGVEAELESLNKQSDLQAAYTNLFRFICPPQGYPKLIAALSPNLVHSFSFQNLIRLQAAEHKPQIEELKPQNHIELQQLCLALSRLHHLAYQSSVPYVDLLNLVARCSSLRDQVKAIVQFLDDTV